MSRLLLEKMAVIQNMNSFFQQNEAKASCTPGVIGSEHIPADNPVRAR
jgi:hypothetical protein